MNCCLSADFGGTEIKTRILSETGEFLSPVRHFPANAKADEHTLLSHIRTVLETAIADAPAPLSRAGLAFPGPFDYENGIPLMQGINKYDALYSKNLRAFLEQAFPAVSFRFANDADLFGLGEHLHVGIIYEPPFRGYDAVGHLLFHGPFLPDGVFADLDDGELAAHRSEAETDGREDQQRAPPHLPGWGLD